MLKSQALAAARRLRTALISFGARSVLTHGKHLHIGGGTKIWAPRHVQLGDHVYIGKHVHIEANCRVGSYCLIANRVAFIGRNDHDWEAVGFPMRYAPWIGSSRSPSRFLREEVVIEDDSWIGFGAILLTGITIGRGCVVAAGSVVTKDVAPYSIVAGVPARVIKQRFVDHATRRIHEERIRNGVFVFSEKGFDACSIKPGELDEL